MTERLTDAQTVAVGLEWFTAAGIVAVLLIGAWGLRRKRPAA